MPSINNPCQASNKILDLIDITEAIDYAQAMQVELKASCRHDVAIILQHVSRMLILINSNIPTMELDDSFEFDTDLTSAITALNKLKASLSSYYL